MVYFLWNRELEFSVRDRDGCSIVSVRGNVFTYGRVMALQPLRYSPRLGSPKLGQGSEMRACACDIPTLSLSREREQEQAAGSRQQAAGSLSTS